SPVLGADGTIYIGSDSGKLFAVNPDGSKKWEFNAGGQIHSVPAIGDDGNIYFGTTENFYVVDQNGNGGTPFGDCGTVLSSPCIELDGIYFGTETGRLVCVPMGTGGWAFPVQGGIPSSPIVPFQLGTVYFCSNPPGKGVLHAIRIPQQMGEDPQLLWSKDLGAPIYSSPSFCPQAELGSAILFVGFSDGWLRGFDIYGSLAWEEHFGTSISSTPAFSQDGVWVYVGVYSGTDRGGLTALDRYFGTEKWTFDQCGPVYSSPCVDKNGAIYFGSLDGKVYALNPDGTKKWEIQTGGPVYSSSCIGEDGTLYIGSTDGKLYAIGSFFMPFPIPTSPVPSLFKVHLLAPLGGETLTGGENFPIKWSVDSSPSGPTLFVLVYSLDGGTTWDQIAAVSGSTSYSWPVPNVDTSKARIRIYWGTGTLESPGSLLSLDESGDFTIVSVSPTTIPPPPLSFPDVPSSYWAYSEIMKLVEEG
ncbi:MAG: PQQ-binding-like beta-propeller repeat protein, partial [Caldisericota bacterium]|nr:PQQ-binding-like beta-propeller repeat protein [Caldisericota bacterium]